jgi:hypothetical protein
MSFPGGLWSPIDRIASQSKKNLKDTVVGTGDQILSVQSSIPLGALASVTSTSTGGSLVGPNLYIKTGSGLQSPQGISHTHSDANSGGTIQNMMLKAVSNLWFVNMLNPTLEKFTRTGTGATYTNQAGYVEIATGTTTNNHGNLRLEGLLYTFAQASNFVTRVKLSSSTTSATARIGMNMETADAVTDNTVKYGFEGCATCNSTNISVISSDGTTRSKNTSSTDSYATVGNFIMAADPGVNVKWRKEAGTIITKTTNVPATGVPNRANTFMACIQTTNTTAKTLDLYGFQIAATIGETNFPTL